jgi:hypothetical protein
MWVKVNQPDETVVEISYADPAFGDLVTLYVSLDTDVKVSVPQTSILRGLTIDLPPSVVAFKKTFY